MLHVPNYDGIHCFLEHKSLKAYRHLKWIKKMISPNAIEQRKLKHMTSTKEKIDAHCKQTG